MSTTHPFTTTAFDLPGYRVVKNFGVVRGIIVRSRSVVGNFGASIQSLFGGNITIYTELCEQARDEAFRDMITHANQLERQRRHRRALRCHGNRAGHHRSVMLRHGGAGRTRSLSQRRKLIMSGHSKWAKVKHFKGAMDAKRAKIFAKLSKEIAIAAKLAGGDPAMNPRLRMVLLKCRAANMPNDNIERAIKRGAGGGDTITYEDLTYEVFGPHGVALLIELSTDNRNRTASEIRSLLTKNGGTIATAGSVTALVSAQGPDHCRARERRRRTR